MKTHQSGYILLITFSMLALCTGLVSIFLVKGMTHKKLAIALLEQEKMNQFVLSTPALAQSFLSFSAEDLKSAESTPAKTSSDKPVPADDGASFAKKLLEKVLPVVNKTQSFSMKEIEKDFPVVINLTFFCESGKININGLYDLVNKTFYNEGVAGKDKKIFATWLFETIAKKTEQPSLLQPFLEHVKQRKAPFNDVTELLAIKEFAACFSQAVFYEPEQSDTNLDKKNQKLFLTDIFTVTSENDTIQPWLLSPSVCVLLDIAQKANKHEEFEKKEDKKIDLSSFKQQVDWQKDWDTTMKPLYDVSFDKIPEPIRPMLATQFSVNTFSMLATVAKESVESENNVSIRIFAILKEKKLPDNSIMYDVIKIYQV
jgi:hypothetical protein